MNKIKDIINTLWLGLQEMWPLAVIVTGVASILAFFMLVTVTFPWIGFGFLGILFVLHMATLVRGMYEEGLAIKAEKEALQKFKEQGRA